MSKKYESELSHNKPSNLKALQLKANRPHANRCMGYNKFEQVYVERGTHVVLDDLPMASLGIESPSPCEQTWLKTNFPKITHACGNKTYQK